MYMSTVKWRDREDESRTRVAFSSADRPGDQKAPLVRLEQSSGVLETAPRDQQLHLNHDSCCARANKIYDSLGDLGCIEQATHAEPAEFVAFEYICVARGSLLRNVYRHMCVTGECKGTTARTYRHMCNRRALLGISVCGI
jgi:hypothetical protein